MPNRSAPGGGAVISRRAMMLGMLTLPLAVWPSPHVSAAETPDLTDDGLHHQPWFLQSFLELAEDLDTAAGAGKRFAIIWELKGCPYCRETHLVNFADPAIAGYIRERFDILQLNIIGSRVVTDFDGEELSEKALARKYGIRFTPTVQFFPDSTDGLSERVPAEREVTRAAGYLKPPHFLAMFRFVEQKAYKEESFRKFVRRNGI